MSKRSHSPGPLHPAKRLHTLEPLKAKHDSNLSFDRLLYDELILSILSYLSWGDLCTTQSVSKNWARLTVDNEIWRKLYLKEFGRTRLRGSKGFIARSDGREVKPLPGRVKNDFLKDWKWMFRISSNWRRGRCAVEESGDFFSGSDPSVGANLIGDRGSHIVLAGALTITASSQYSDQPAISILDTQGKQTTLIYESVEQELHQITALALDQSPPDSGHLALACFLSTNEFSVFGFNAAEPSSFVRTLTYRPRRNNHDSVVVRAAYYHPLVVTLSNNFELSIYDLSANNPRLTQTLSAITCYPPTSLVLSSPSANQYKLIISYTTPVYPRHWSVGATELMITSLGSPSTHIPTETGLSSSTTFQEEFRYALGSTMMVTSSRTIRAFDVPNVWLDTVSLQAMREQWGRKLLTVAATETDGKWVVLAPGDNLNEARNQFQTPSASGLPNFQSPTGLQLYRLVFPVSSNSVSAPPPKLNFVRTLHGHSSVVSALALADGRCVSLGEDGGIWVWDLEAGSGAEVARADTNLSLTDPGRQRGTITFDERRIVCCSGGKVLVRHFDI